MIHRTPRKKSSYKKEFLLRCKQKTLEGLVLEKNAKEEKVCVI